MGYPYFHGATDGDAYFRWEYQLEQSFEGHDYSDMAKCYYAQLQFRGHASSWWSESNFLRHFYGRKPKATTWTELKIDMRKRFVPPIYWQRIAEGERIEEERRLRNERRIRREDMMRQKELEEESKKQDKERKKVDEERKTEADLRSKKAFDLFWEDCKKRFAALDAENKLRKANNTPLVATCTTIEDQIFISSELHFPIVDEVVPKDELVDVLDEPIESVVMPVGLTCGHKEDLLSKGEVVVKVDAVSMDEMDVGPEFQTDAPVDAILVDIGNEEAHVPSIEPPLHCVVPAYSLQVHAPSVDDIGDVFTLAGSLMQLKDIQAAHIYHDPFLVHCTPFDFIVADWFAVHIRLALRTMAIWFASLFFLAVHHSVGLIPYVRPRLLFDPGGFEDESFRTRRE